jgi:hypothetical protein
LRLFIGLSRKTQAAIEETSGRTHLNTQQTLQIGMVPTGIELFASDPALFGFLSFKSAFEKSMERKIMRGGGVAGES